MSTSSSDFHSGFARGTERLAILFERFGPYHAARINAAARCMPTVAIELRSSDKTYLWEHVKSGLDCARRTLLAASDFPVSAARIQHVLHEALDELKPEAVAIPGWSGAFCLSALHWCRKTGTPAILMSESQQSDAARDVAREWIKRRILRRYAAALVGGTPQRDYLIRLGFPPDRIAVGYDAVDNAYFAAKAQNYRREATVWRKQFHLPENYFLASARFIERKNLLHLVEAFSIYRKRTDAGWNLVILGDGPLRRELEHAINKLEVGDSVLLAGVWGYEDLPAAYALGRVFIHASLVEPWGLVVNEAMACGLPVLVSAQSGCAKDLVHEGQNGYVFDARAVDLLAELMKRMTHADLRPYCEQSRAIIDRWSPDAFSSGMQAALHAAQASVSAKMNAIAERLFGASVRKWARATEDAA